MRKNTLYTLFYLILLLSIVGCTNKNIASEDLEKDISKLESEILNLNQSIEKQQQLGVEQEKKIMLNESKMETIKESHTVLHNNFHALNELVNLTLDSKTAMLNSAEINGDILNLNITYTEKINDQNDPNGFHLEETEGGTITLSISENVPIYLVKSASSLIQVDWEEVITHRGLLQLYEKDGEVIFISEIYLP
jgi:TolA-binding protein